MLQTLPNVNHYTHTVKVSDLTMVDNFTSSGRTLAWMIDRVSEAKFGYCTWHEPTSFSQVFQTDDPLFAAVVAALASGGPAAAEKIIDMI